MTLLLKSSAAEYRVQISTTEASADFVVLLHGLRGSSTDFQKMDKVLLEHGFNVCRIDYPSRKYSIEALADTAISEVIRQCEPHGCQTLHFVAHSMGCIMVRYYLQENKIEKLGRIIFISPPNHGTELVDKFAWSALFRKFNGPGGMQLGAGENGFIKSLEMPPYEFGVIMSTRSINPVESMFIHGKDDGRVSIESARLEGMRDFVLVRSNHHVAMKKDETIKQVINFLHTGQFEKDLDTD